MASQNHPLPWVGRSKSVRVAVIGDVILDEYLDGSVNRISPEAPVPVHLVTRSFQTPGGAANAARNIKLAGGEPQLVSVWGDDEAGRQLANLLAKDNISTDHMVVVDDRPTVRKTRLTANSQQMVRIDWEKVHPIKESSQNKILDALKGMEFDAIVISDYGKGMLPISLLSNVLALASERKVPTIVDPKGRDYSKYLHATLITPNRNEACEALGLDPTGDWDGAELGRRLISTFGLHNVLVTLGSKGMVLVSSQQPNDPVHLPATAREVYDVSGAGDTVVAMMALAHGAGATMVDAMRIAQKAAAVVVEKWGTQPVSLAELEREMRAGAEVAESNQNSSDRKISSRESLNHTLKDPASRSKKVVFTNGCFDILHAGHVSYLEAAKARGDLLVVGVNTDESVRRLKGDQRPYVSLDDRMRLLAALGCVDHVVPFAEDTPKELIELLLPDVLVKGADYEKHQIVGSDTVTNAGGVVDTIEFVPGRSTSGLVEKIRNS